MKVLIIKKNSDSFEKLTNKWLNNTNDVQVKSIITNKKGIAKRIYIISCLYKYSKGNYDKVIIFDNVIIFLYAHLFFKSVYLWLWNTIPNISSFLIRIKLCKLLNFKIYSFDEEDCKKYNLEYNTQFFYKETECYHEIYDLYFIGVDKGRCKQIEKIYQFLKQHNVNTFFQVIPDKGKNYKCKEILQNSYVEYTEVISNVLLSKAILDIPKPGQVGMTYRAMEALFYDKKIVTTNRDYRNLNFFSSDMVFVLDEDNCDLLPEFLKSESVGYSEQIKQYYSIENWIMRFL